MLDLTVLGAKVEAVPGTRLAPSLATDALLGFNYNPVPLQATQVRRSIDVPYAGKRPSLLTAVHARHPFSVELAGSGTAITPAYWGKLLQACLFGAPVPTGANVGYPLSSAGDGFAISLDGWKDSVRHRAFGMRGNAVFDFTEKQLPSIAFDLLGQIYLGTPADGSAPGGVTLPAYPQPVEVNLANTAITLDGFTLGVQSFKLDLGNKPVLYSTTGSRAIIFDKTADADRRGVTGTLIAELPDPAVKSYFPAAIAGTQLAFTLTHGTIAGNIIQLASASFVPTNITYSVVSNRIFMNMPFDLIPTGAGSNELTLTTL